MTPLFRVCIVWALLCALLLAGAALPAQAESPILSTPQSLSVVRIRVTPPFNVQQLAAHGLDLLEMREGDTLFALVTAEEHAALAAEGWDVRVDEEQTALLHQSSTQSFDEDYHTVEEAEQLLNHLATTYPNLATLVDFGDSWEREQSGGSQGYNLYALRITNQTTEGEKPVFFLMGGIHARELMSVEVALHFAQYLLENYGVDPDVTWMVDEHEIVVAPIMNPDGHKLAEQGYLQRKNTNASYGGDCGSTPGETSQYGVDLNRNSSFQWGVIDEPTLDPCQQTFPGGSPASEPETQAVQTFLASLYPDHTAPTSDTAAPDTTTGVFITLHSYANLILWPWGHTYDPAPNATGLERLGERLADANGYVPQQSSRLYLSSGTTDDWTYATFGIPSYTVEIGPGWGTCGGFTPPYSCLEAGNEGTFWPLNRPALLYAARVVDAPYVQPGGPHSSVSVVSDTVSLTLTVTLDGGESNVTAAEIYAGSSPWHGGTPHPLQPMDGAFDSPQEQAQLVLSREPTESTSTTQDRTLLLVRGQNSDTIWGPLQAVWGVPLTETPSRPGTTVWIPLVLAPGL